MNDVVQMVVLSAVAISCGLLGPFLVLKRLAMFANALSHTVLLGIALAFLIFGRGLFDLFTLFVGGLIAALVTAFFTEGLIRLFRLQEDASVGLVFTALFALGIIVVTVFMRDVHLGIEAIMGNADVLQWSDLKGVAFLSVFNLGVIFLFYKQFLLSSFDRNSGRGVFHFLLLFLVALTCVGAFRAVGVLLVLGYLVGPFLTARLFCYRLPWLLFWSPVIGIIASIGGVLLSRYFLHFHGLPLSTGGIVVTLIGLFYVICNLYKLIACAKESPS